jgi:hypothetical protein
MINRRLAAILATGLAFIIAVVTMTSFGPKPATDYSTLLDYLRDSGASVVDQGELSGFFFDDGSQSRGITVNGSDMSVHEYTSSEAMEAAASHVSLDGSAFEWEESGNLTRTVMVEWVAPSHFYKSGRIIVIYIGEDDSVISLLRNGLGRQFAGR